MSNKDYKLDKILENLEELTQMFIDYIAKEMMEDIPEWMEEAPSDAIQAFRITERVFNEIGRFEYSNYYGFWACDKPRTDDGRPANFSLKFHSQENLE